MSKIQLTDSFFDVVAKMSEGNPGAMNVIMELYEKGEQIDPQGMMGGMGIVLLLDTFKIYGTDIYVLWSDICERQLNKTIAMVRAAQLGLFDPAILADACHRQDYSGKALVPVEELYGKVREQLTEFDRIA